ncbi:(2Fe-2S)-binding protein [Caballeronia mineralivorans PML1(12)]|uniref:(2Fe-2S)-binding protein n=1 Tax=Caballeronia mineralivorans PML1(12) TaxID=908627 RepID=A0A0J1D3C3_9BURK|nr:(2Fe-2S)-binding protein [Caballeronia mineralivorans]KLU27232.1 (2Fe-2S)-binding protein [Caballeronia mineralivorans PML1(12)]
MLNAETMRIDKADRAATVWFFFDGQPASARVGESVAAALFASGMKTLRTSPRECAPRGMFCLMGSCQECLVMVDGRRVLACRTAVADGMHVEKVPGAGSDA